MRVVVVGAGLSGLTAAHQLTQGGVDVVVLEARERVGGRMHGIEVAPGAWVDAGAAYLGDRHTELTAMIADLGLRTVPTGMVGDSRFMLGNGGTTRPGRFPPLSAVALGDMFELLDGLTRRVVPHAPWETPGAEELDGLTAAAWAEQHLTREDARLFFPLFLGEMMAADPAEVSMLHVAFYLSSGGGISYLNDFEGGAQDSRVDGGAHRVCEALAAELPDGCVHLGEPVLAIDDTGEVARVTTTLASYDADAVVVAVPPLIAERLSIAPPPQRPRATDRTGRGCAVKVHLVYPEPSWREAGLSGWSVNADGPLLSTVDDSPEGVGVLTGFVTGAEAHRFAALPYDEQRAEVTDQARQIFPDLPVPDAVHVTDWLGEEWSAGCYAAVLGPGDWSRLGPYATTPHGRVHWAGTETSTEFFGLMEGAIRSGRRAAAEVLDRTTPSPRSTTMTETRTSIAPLEVREAFATDPDLGAGNFLDKALAANPHRDVPFAFTHHLDHAGQVVLKGHSLEDLVRLRDLYAGWYHANGVRPGEPVAVVTAEGLTPLIHFFALSALGAIPALVNDAMRPDIMVRYLDHVGVVGVVADDTTRLATAYRNGLARRPRFVATTSEVEAGDPSMLELPAAYPYQHGADDVVALIHSSGTTGIPKSTILAHRQFWDGKQPRMTRFPATEDDRLMCLMPHTHAGGLSYFMTATLLGLPIAVMSDWRREVVEPVMEAFLPTMMASFPRTYVELATGDLPVAGAAKVHSWFNTGDSAHHGHIRRLVTLGERPAGLIKPWLLPRDAAEESPLPGSQFIDGLGSSEMGMANFGQVSTPETPRDDRCVGRPLEVVTAAVLDETGAEVPDGTVGLLGVKSPSLTPGYWNNDRLTESFRLEGWWLTGDVARREPDGRFYHLDRTVDVIDTATGPAYSLPIEEVLLADCADTVRDCSVVGVPAADGSRPIAVVQLQADADGTTPEMLLERANKELAQAGLHELAAVVVATEPGDFPLGPTGKVLKRELRTRHARLLLDA